VPVDTTRVHGPCSWAVNMGSGYRALEKLTAVIGHMQPNYHAMVLAVKQTT